MTILAQEEGGIRGRPRELYRFTRGSNTWRFTSNDSDVVAIDGTYITEDIKRSSIEYTGDLNRSNLVITVGGANDIAEMFKGAAPGEIVAVTVMRLHETMEDDGVPGASTSSITLWTGRVLGSRWGPVGAELQCEPASISLKRIGLRRLYQRQCPHVLYSEICGASRALFLTTATITLLSGKQITVGSVGGHPDGMFSGGYLSWASAGGYSEYRMILSHVGMVLTVAYPLPPSATGTQITLYGGCNHTTSDCNTKFNNLNNYGGFPYIPEKNPFGGSPIF